MASVINKNDGPSFFNLDDKKVILEIFSPKLMCSLLLQILFNVNFSSSYLIVRKSQNDNFVEFPNCERKKNVLFLIWWLEFPCNLYPLCQNPFWPRYWAAVIGARAGPTRSPLFFDYCIRVISCCSLISTGAWNVTWREVCCNPILFNER